MATTFVGRVFPPRSSATISGARVPLRSCGRGRAVARSELDAETNSTIRKTSLNSRGSTPLQARRAFYQTQGIETVSRGGVTVEMQSTKQNSPCSVIMTDHDGHLLYYYYVFMALVSFLPVVPLEVNNDNGCFLERSKFEFIT